ncbi:hypothetical protein A5880_003024 [Enterococcus sp. 4G2_DIV0659]|uniref:Uncharacterized protein n=1 Tax=Candidatus Enterococcus mansonii TaxID=1834181 RepID=A0A242CJ14_9ENTE|nr:hypothetical protein A5880_000918 [Enterococcus sp. 4G2_DIV0659]
MSKVEWHVTRKGSQPTVIRHYKHIINMYNFILRNPAMFSGRQLTIFNHGKPMIDITFDDVKKR